MLRYDDEIITLLLQSTDTVHATLMYCNVDSVMQYSSVLVQATEDEL